MILDGAERYQERPNRCSRVSLHPRDRSVALRAAKTYLATAICNNCIE